MRTFPFLLVGPVLIFSCPALADWPALPTEVVPVYPATKVIEPLTDGNGGAFFLVAGAGDVRLLRLDASGEIPSGWAVEGLPLATSLFQEQQDIAPDGAGGVYVAWSTGTECYLQHGTADGSIAPGWPSGGLNVAAGSNVALEADGAGGVYVVWEDLQYVRTTRILPDGTPAAGWFASGKILASASSSSHMVATADGQGGCYFSQMALDVPTGNLRTRVDHRNGAGTVTAAWLSDPYVSPGVRQLYAAPDGTGGVVVTWTRCLVNSSGPYETDQVRLLDSCTPAPGWPSGTSWLTIADAWTHRQFVDEQGGVITAWFTETGTARVSRRELDGTTTPGWPADGVLLPGAYGAPATLYYAMDIVPDGTGGVLYSWLTTQVTAGRIEAGGAYASGWPVGGLLLDSFSDTRVYLGLVPDGLGGAIASWRVSDNEVAPSAAQHFNGDGTLGPSQNVAVQGIPPEAFALSLPRPNPAATSVVFSVDLPERTRLSIAVFDSQGRLVRRLAAGSDLAAGSHAFRWNLTDPLGARVRPGIYLIRVASPAGMVTRRAIVIE